MSRAWRIILKRLAAALPTLLLVASGAFVLLSFAGGDAVDAYFAETAGAGGNAGELRQRWGLGGTAVQRYFSFLLGALTFNFGQSIIFSRPVMDVIVERLPVTLMLMAAATGMAASLGIWLGIKSGARPDSCVDRSINGVTLLLNAMPNFWLGIILIVVFAVNLQWFPVSGLQIVGPGGTAGGWTDKLHHLVLPACALGLGYLAMYVRTLRAGMIATWPQDHVRSAQARGLEQNSILWRAVARPALLPAIVLIGQQAGALFGGSVVIETVFAVPGFGRLAYEAVTGRDTALLIGVALCSTCFVIAANLCVDLLLTMLDPRGDQPDA
ncbi:MAG: ABC transporter permease [Beijerinckiaceae bacterium]